MLFARSQAVVFVAVIAIPATASPQCLEHLRVGVDASVASAFGCDVAIDGAAAIVGAQYQDLTGAAYVFRRSGPGGLWSQEVKLVGSDSIASDEFGASVAIADNTIMVGASGASGAALSCGAVYVFRYDPANGAWNQTQKLVASDGEASTPLAARSRSSATLRSSLRSATTATRARSTS